MSPGWYHRLLRQCREPGELTGVRITTLQERFCESSFRQESLVQRASLVLTTVAYWSPRPGRLEYAAYRSIPQDGPDKKMRRLIAVGRLFKCPLRIQNENLTDIKCKICHLCVRSEVRKRLEAGHPLHGERRRHELPSENPLMPKTPRPIQLDVPRYATPRLMEVMVHA